MTDTTIALPRTAPRRWRNTAHRTAELVGTDITITEISPNRWALNWQGQLLGHHASKEGAMRFGEVRGEMIAQGLTTLALAGTRLALTGRPDRGV
ncbi:hypothetical protein LNKW23_18290 [Paralimibaculum aggregatum]|uniref:Uncharacterized protein n=1 Tax=Paralimibaculum aggregatum TaxID=3036245 RepID=A0ABQ6LJM7_9RHOB|nr:hypothetical protein [Limibaculum sp. NKW23]GMG82616.1 hypothetical protein LNKW23_18290 [Limibaculum sp. NKW23]